MKGKMAVIVMFCLFGLKAILCNSFVMFCIMGLAEQPSLHGCVSKLLCFLAGFIQWKTLASNETEERGKADYFAVSSPHAFVLDSSSCQVVLCRGSSSWWTVPTSVIWYWFLLTSRDISGFLSQVSELLIFICFVCLVLHYCVNNSLY